MHSKQVPTASAVTKEFIRRNSSSCRDSAQLISIKVQAFEPDLFEQSVQVRSGEIWTD